MTETEKKVAFESALAELSAELEKALAIDPSDEISEKVAAYRAELEETAEADKQAKIDDITVNLSVIKRLIEKTDIKIAEEAAKQSEEAIAEAESVQAAEQEEVVDATQLAEV
ncbi:MAG: hypothetical protein M0R31_06370 [Candidatus Riflebacteria bacterium]|nr:hypothetical protein [Candidatus Riflebacteria bacterium]